MMRIYIAFLLIAIVAIGCNKKAKPKTNGDGHVHNEDGSHVEPESPASHATKLSVQALKNMGVVVEEVDSSDYTVSRPVAAVIEETPFNERPMVAPFSGRVRSINVVLGEYLNEGQAVIEIIRDPLPRVELTMTENLLKPASDEFHNIIAELRKARIELSINGRERKRLEGFETEKGQPLIPKQTMIDLTYEAERIAQEVANTRSKLKLHGFSDKEIDNIEKGKGIVQSKNLWLSALKQNGIWTKDCEAILQALPEKTRANQWAIATLGELSAEGLINADLVKFCRKSGCARTNIIAIGGLLQQGNSLEDISDLCAQCAFDPIIVVKAPLGKDWDVEAIHVKKGELVDRGTTLVTLTNHSDVYLTGTPVGSEIEAINIAIREDRKFSAIPLTPNAGPTLTDLQVSKILGLDDEGTKVLLPAKNGAQSVKTVNGKKFRNWKLRNRMKYILQVPHKVLEEVIVLPSTAVVDFGNEKVIYVKEGDEFKRRRVVVAYRDDRVVVLGDGSEVFPDEPMVVKGAFSLGLALRAAGGGSTGADAHAGCDHD